MMCSLECAVSPNGVSFLLLVYALTAHNCMGRSSLPRARLIGPEIMVTIVVRA